MMHSSCFYQYVLLALSMLPPLALACTRASHVKPTETCNKDMHVSPYYLEPAYKTTRSEVCFTVRVQSPIKKGPCNNMDVASIELEVDPKCNGALESYEVDGELRVQPVFESRSNRAVVKLNRINLTKADADGTQVCVTLGNQCPTMRDLCPAHDGSCRYRITGPSPVGACCPVGPLGFFLPPSLRLAPMVVRSRMDPSVQARRRSSIFELELGYMASASNLAARRLQ